MKRCMVKVYTLYPMVAVLIPLNQVYTLWQFIFSSRHTLSYRWPLGKDRTTLTCVVFTVLDTEPTLFTRSRIKTCSVLWSPYPNIVNHWTICTLWDHSFFIQTHTIISLTIGQIPNSIAIQWNFSYISLFVQHFSNKTVEIVYDKWGYGVQI